MKLTLVEHKVEEPNVESFIFKPAEALSWKAGQFLRYTLPHEPVDERGTSRWFTIASTPFEKVVQLTTRFSEKNGSTFKKALRALQIGDEVEASGADGSFVIGEGASRPYVFIAGGIGITPFRAILKQTQHENMPITATLLYANRDEHIIFKEELEALTQDIPNLKIHYILSPQHIDENTIKKLVPDLQKPLWYISGPEPMVEGVTKTLQTMNVSTDQMKRDWFPGYSAE